MGVQERRLEQHRSKPDEKWNARLKELLQYTSEHGDCSVPQKQGKLGTWASKQRTRYMAGSLAQGRIDQLNGIGFRWALLEQGPKVPWETRFKQLVQYKAKNDGDVPQRQGQLRKWVQKQRTNYRKGKLSQDRIDRLNGIDFEWTPLRKGGAGERLGQRQRKLDEQWNARFEGLLSYRSEHGDCDVPQRQGWKVGRPSANSLQDRFACARSHRSAQQHRLCVETEGQSALGDPI